MYREPDGGGSRRENKPQPDRHETAWPVRRLGPGSLLWDYAGDQRLGFVGLATGLLQLMHPAIGAGVAEHSAFFTEPWRRIQRSMPEILGVIYDRDPEMTGRRVRNFHRTIKGVDQRGRHYRALNPDTFWYAHATFQWGVETLVDRFDRRRLTPVEREELYLDGVEWYRRYGMSMRPVPIDHQAFCLAWDRYCEDVLEFTPAAEHAVDLALHAKTTKMPGMPWWTVPMQRFFLTPLLRLTAIGGLPSVVRRRFGIPWRPDEEVEYRLLQLSVREGWRFVLPPLRYHPRAASGRLTAEVARQPTADDAAA
jgi:uncharacterized protein (DUF2236 family)